MEGLSLYTETFASRRDDFVIQCENGRYHRAGRPLTLREVRLHLSGMQTIGTYVIDEQGQCSYVVFDADDPEHGLSDLCTLRDTLATQGITSYLEQSRRAGHLWVFFTEPVHAALARAWMSPYCPQGVELYPKQDASKRYGAAIRLPFGVHLRSGKRYPFVEPDAAATLVPVAATVASALTWLKSIQRVSVPQTVTKKGNEKHTPTSTPTSFSLPSLCSPTQHGTLSIRQWNALQNPFEVIGHYVQLNSAHVGQCPFSWHHTNGQDSNASFKVYPPGVPGGYSWYCYTWQQGGSVFDFLRYYYSLDARTLWNRIQHEQHGHLSRNYCHVRGTE